MSIHIAERRSIDVLLAEARRRLDRLSPRDAREAQLDGALLVDIRPEVNRTLEGEIPGALVIERIHLEWRLDPASEAKLPEASYDAHVVLICNEGYSSSLAAVTLQDLGVVRATDMIGGFRAWKIAGLPVTTRTSS